MRLAATEQCNRCGKDYVNKKQLDNLLSSDQSRDSSEDKLDMTIEYKEHQLKDVFNQPIDKYFKDQKINKIIQETRLEQERYK